jgi:glycosyltransferase involved in cell wall biosynthesis
MIDIIIPYYNTPVNLFSKCLRSIAAQTIADDIYVTIVNDGSDNIDELRELLTHFKYKLNGRCVNCKDNHGPGFAREFGLVNTEQEYVMFVDADDVLSPVAAETLLYQLKDNSDKAMAVGQIYDLNTSTMQTKIIDTQLVWVFAKMYRRSAINEYEIAFNITKDCSYANEDVGFNVQFPLLLGNESIVYIKEPLYYWSNENVNSITRKNNCEYEANFCGYIMNMTKTYLKCHSKITNRQAKEYALIRLIDIYRELCRHIKGLDAEKDHSKIMKYFAYSAIYYKTVFQEFDGTYDDLYIKNKWLEATQGFGLEAYPHFVEFIKMLRKSVSKDKKGKHPKKKKKE